MPKFQRPTTKQKSAPTADPGTITAQVMRLHDAVKFTHSLGELAENVACKLAGHAPEDGSVDAPSPLPTGLYEELYNVIENLHAALYRIETALARASNKLG